MGDFNVATEPIDVHDPKRLKDHVDFHPEARAALERVREWGFVDDSGVDQERILDLLRRDEELRRGTSCVAP